MVVTILAGGLGGHVPWRRLCLASKVCRVRFPSSPYPSLAFLYSWCTCGAYLECGDLSPLLIWHSNPLAPRDTCELAMARFLDPFGSVGLAGMTPVFQTGRAGSIPARSLHFTMRSGDATGSVPVLQTG